MILDASELGQPRELSADVCIVGAGPVGIAIALELARAGRDVLLLEAGGLAHDEAAQADYAGEVADARLHGPLDTCRERGLGGTSALWAGRSAPFDPIDFERRDWIADSGWPIPYAAVQAYYPRAARWCELGEAAFDAGTAFDRPLRPMIEGFGGGAS